MLRDPIRALKELNRVLKPNGLLCLVEAFPDPDYPLPRTEIKWTKDAGFTLDSRYGNWFILSNLLKIQLIFIALNSPEPEVKVFIPMYEPLEVTKCEKCRKVIGESKNI